MNACLLKNEVPVDIPLKEFVDFFFYLILPFSIFQHQLRQSEIAAYYGLPEDSSASEDDIQEYSIQLSTVAPTDSAASLHGEAQSFNITSSLLEAFDRTSNIITSVLEASDQMDVSNESSRYLVPDHLLNSQDMDASPTSLVSFLVIKFILC